MELFVNKKICIKAEILVCAAIVILLMVQSKSVYSQEKDLSASETPFVLGRIVKLESKILSETRVLNIYIPPDYNKSDTTKYPVIYLLDGGANEDFIHVTGLVQFNTLPWVNTIPPSIVVGIVNTDRKRDFTFPSSLKSDTDLLPTSGKSGNFISFIEQELQPYISAKYKTNSSKTIIGQSLGGLLATEILFKKPAMFNKYIIISPSLWWDNGSLLNEKPDILSEKYQRKTVVYIGVGKEGLAPSYLPHVMEVDANLLAEKLRSGKNKELSIYFDYLPQENHATITHQALFNAFRLVH